MNESATAEVPRPPIVYFIDDSATMREVMKIAFRRENISVVAYPDPLSALNEIEEASPDVVISDVIMPEKNGFEVCQFIKEHPQLAKTPVVLLSGVVNREVTDKALSVKADELIRKPFQPQDLIARVKQLIISRYSPVANSVPVAAADPARSQTLLSDIFGSAPLFAWEQGPAAVIAPPPPPSAPAPAPRTLLPPRAASRQASADTSKLRLEMVRLESLVKKLQSELAAERDYARALEAHIKTLQESE